MYVMKQPALDSPNKIASPRRRGEGRTRPGRTSPGAPSVGRDAASRNRRPWRPLGRIGSLATRASSPDREERWPDQAISHESEAATNDRPAGAFRFAAPEIRAGCDGREAPNPAV